MRISQLNIFPVKSMAGVQTSEVTLDRFGPQWDRRWMLVKPDGKFLTQREKARMTLMTARLMDQNQLQLTAPAQPILTLPIPLATSELNSMKVVVWGDECDAQMMGPEADTWASEFLQTECHLVYMPESTLRKVDSDYAQQDETVGFADGFPLLVISEASLAAINAELETPVSMLNFRPNIVIDGCEAFAEDTWKGFTTEGGVHLSIVKPCSRCVIPSIDPQTAEKNSDVLRVLNRLRKGDDGKVYLGQNLLYSANAIGKQLLVGQTIKTFS